MKETYDKALNFVLDAEGRGYEDVPGDAGGPTRAGCTFRDVASIRGINPATVRTHEAQVALAKGMTDAEMHAIYRKLYWQPVDGDALPYPLDMVLFDSAVNLGVTTSIVLLRLAMGRPVAPPSMADTMKTVGELGSNLPVVVSKLLALRRARYQRIAQHNPGDEKFLKGWLSRVNHLAAAIKAK